SSNSNSGSWQVAGELQSSNVSWLKTAEVVLAPRTAKSQTVTVSTNVTLVDSVSSRAVVVEVWHVVRSIPDPRSLVSSAAMLQPVVVESREDEPALLSLGKLSVLGESLDSAAVWAEYWSVDVILRGVALSKSIKHVILWGVPFEVCVFGGGHIVEMKSRPMTPGELVVTKRENDSLNWLEVHPKHSFRGIFNGSVVIAFRSKVSSLEVVEVACPLRVAWTSEVIDVPTNDTVNVTQFLGPFKMESVVFENETLVVIPRSYVMASFERGKESLAGADFMNLSLELPEWSNWVLMHRARRHRRVWTVGSIVQVPNLAWGTFSELVAAPRGNELQPVTLSVNVSLMNINSGDLVVVRFEHIIRVVFDPRVLLAGELNDAMVFEAEYQAPIRLPADPVGIVARIAERSNDSATWIIDNELRGVHFNGIRNFTVDGRNLTTRLQRYRTAVTLPIARKDIIEGNSVLVTPADAFSGVTGLSFAYIFTETSSMMKVEVEIKVLLYWLPAPKEVDPVSMDIVGDESHNTTISGEALDELISTVFVDSAYRRDFLLYISSTPLTFAIQVDKSNGYQLVPENRYYSGHASIRLKAVLQDKNVPFGETSTSYRQFGALPNVTLIVTLEVFIAPVATIPLLNATIARAAPPYGTAIVVSISAITLQDLDGSEELSVELSAQIGSDVLAVFFNNQLLQPNTSGSDATSESVAYALPVPASTMTGIVGTEVMLVALDASLSGKFGISLTATSRELYYTNMSAANATVATAVYTAEVGWAPEPAVYYVAPLDVWFEGQEDTAVVIPLRSIRESLLADAPLAGDDELQYGPWRLAWDAGRVDAVFVNDASVETPHSFGDGSGLLSLGLAEDQSFEFGVSENVSVVPGQGYYGEVAVALSVEAYSSTRSQVYILAANLRIAVVPVASTRFFSAAPNGSAVIHLGFNRELDVIVSEGVTLSTAPRSSAEIAFFVVDADNNANAAVSAQSPSFWLCSGDLVVGGTPWSPNGMFALVEEARSRSLNGTFAVLPPPDYVGSLPVTMQSVAVMSNLIPTELVSSNAVIDASGAAHGWLTVLSTSIVESLLPTEWNHAQAPTFGVVNASSRVYEDELGVVWISELEVADLDSTAPDMILSLEVLLPEMSNLSVSLNGSSVLASGKETLDGTVYVVVQLPADSKAVRIAAGPTHSTHAEGFLRASVYAFSSSNATTIAVSLDFLTVAEQPTLSVAVANTSISEGGMFYGDITVLPTKAELYYRVQAFFSPAFIAEVAGTSLSQSWSTGSTGISSHLLSSFSTHLGSGVGTPTSTLLSLVPIAKISGNLSVDVLVVTSTVDMGSDFFASECYLRASSSKNAYNCLPSAQWKSMTVTSQSIALVIYPVAEAPRFVVSPAVLSIAENSAAFVTVSNWTLGDTDGSESMYLRLRCAGTYWQEVSVDSISSNRSGDATLTAASFELLPLGVSRSDTHADLSVQLSPPSYFSGSIECTLVAHAIDSSGAFVSEDTYEVPLSAAVIPEATVPLVSLATTAFTAVEDGVVVCDSVAASLVDADGSEALFLVVDFGEYDPYVTSVTWRSGVSVASFSSKADGAVPSMVFGEASQRVVAAGAGQMEMRGGVEIGLVAGYSGELHLSIWSASIETAYLASDEVSDAAVASALAVSVDVAIAPVADTPLLGATIAQPVAPAGSALVVSISAITLQDLDGSEELSVELSAQIGSDVLAVFFNNQLLQPGASGSDATSESVAYALPVPASTMTGIVGAEVMLVALDASLSGKFGISLTATSRELYYTNMSAANATVATAVYTAEVGWAPEPAVYYVAPLDVWFEGQEDTAVVIPLRSIRESLLADAPLAGDDELQYGPWRLAWDAGRVDAVFVNDASVETPHSFGDGSGLLSLGLAEDQSFEFGVSENVSVVPGQGYYGEVAVALSVEAYSSTRSQVYILAAKLRMAEVPVARTRFFTAAQNGTAPRSSDEITFFVVDADNNANAAVSAQSPSFWLCSGDLVVGGTPWSPNGMFALVEEARSRSLNGTFAVLPPPDYVGSLPVTMQSVAVMSNLIPTELVSSNAVIDASGAAHGWLTVLSTSIVESLLPTEWNHAQAPTFGVVNASSRVYEDELGVVWISELEVADLDSTAPDMILSLEVLLPEMSNLSVSLNGSSVLASGKETLDGTVYVVVQLPADSKAVRIAAGPTHSTHAEGFLRASVYAFSSSNATTIAVSLDFLTVAEQPTLSVAVANTSISEGGMFYGDITVLPTKAELYYRVQAFFSPAFIAEVAGTSLSQSWSTGSTGISSHLLSSFSTHLGSGVGTPTSTLLSLVPIAKISGNLSVDVLVVTSTVDMGSDFFASECYLRASSSKNAYNCLPSAQWKSMTVTSQSIALVIYPVAEAPRFVVSPAVLSIAENSAAFVTVSNWTLGDTDGSESMYLRLRCAGTYWQEVSVDSISSNRSGDATLTAASFELLPLGVYRSDTHADLSVQLSPPSYFSGFIECTLVAHAIDRSGTFVSEDTYEVPLSATVIPEATVPLVSLATTALTAVEDGVVVCDSVAASLVDADGSEALFLVVDFGEYDPYVTSVTWRSGVSVASFSSKADGAVPSMVFGEASQRVVAAGAGQMEMRGGVEIGLVAGYSGELHLSIWSASIEKLYLASGTVPNGGVARAGPLQITVHVTPICHVADVVLKPVTATTKPLVAVPIQVIGFTIDTDGSEILTTQVSVNTSAVLSLYGTNASENWLAGGDTTVLPRVDSQPVFRVDQIFTVVPRADFVGFFVVNVTVKTTELETGETKIKSVVATLLVTPVDPLVRVSPVSHGYWNEFVQLPFQRLDVQQEVVSREHLLLYVENRTQVADIYAGCKRLAPLALGAVDLYVVPYALRDVVSVRPREYWYGNMKLFALVTTVAFDIASTPNRTAYQGTSDGIVILDIPVMIHPRPVAPSSSLSTSTRGGFVVVGKPISLTFDGVFPYESWGRSITGGMTSQLAMAPQSVVDSLSSNLSMAVTKAALRGIGAYGLYSTGNISGNTHLRFLISEKNSYSGPMLATVTTKTTDVLRQTMLTNVSNVTWRLVGEAYRGVLGFGKSIRVFQVGDNQNITFRLSDFGLMSELTDLVSVQAFIAENAVDGLLVGSTLLTGEADVVWGSTMKFGDLRFDLHGSKSPACLPAVEPSCLLSRIITVMPRKYAAQTFNVTMKIVSRVSINDTAFGSLSTATTFGRCRVVVMPVPNTPVLVLNSTSLTMLEDIAAAFTIVEASTPDRDGSEVIEVDMSFDPLYLDGIQVDGISVTTPAVAGTVVLLPRSSTISITTNRIVSLFARRNFAGSFTIQIGITSIEGSTGEVTRISTSLSVIVIAVADTPVIYMGTTEIRVNQNVTGELTVASIALTDVDNSETLRLVISDPSGSALKAAEMSGGTQLVKDGAGSKFTLSSLPVTSSNLLIRLTPVATWFGSTQLQLSAVSRESSNGNEATTSISVAFTVLPVADVPTLIVENTRGQLAQATRIGLVSVSIPNQAKLDATSLTVYLVPRSTDLIEVKWQSQVLSLETTADVSSSGLYRLPSTTTLQQPTVTVSTAKWVSSVTFDVVVVAAISVSGTSQRTSQAATVTFAAVQLSSTSFNLTEGVTGSLSLTLLSAPLSAVTVTFTSSLTTRAITVPTSATFTSTDWNVAKTVQISTVNNFLDDANAVATISGVTSSSDAVYLGYPISTVMVQVFNDDYSGFAVYQGSTKTTAPALVVAEGRVFSDTYNIVLLAQPTADVSVTLTTSLSILVVAPTSVTFTASDWNVPKAIAVAADDNFVVDGDRTATISSVVTSSDPLYSTKTIANLNVKIVETKDTTPPPKILDAKFLDTAVGLTITFDRAVDRTTLVADNFACSVLFDLPTATDSTNYCGVAPPCTWQTGSLSIRFVFGQGAKIVPGSTLALRANLLKSTATAELAAPAVNLIVSAPDKAPRPQVLVSGATSLGMCDDLFLDGSSSSGSGGRSMMYTWMLVNTSSVTTSSVDSVKALLASAATTNNATIKIAAAVLEADGIYSFVLLASNFFGKMGNSNEIVIKKSGMALPSVSIKGGGLQGAYRAAELVITASASYPSCSGTISTDSTGSTALSTGVDMTFTWLQVAGDLTSAQFKSTSPNARILKLPAATLTVGVNYVFRLFVAMASNAKVNNTADVQIAVARTDLTPLISAGNRSVGVEQDLVLDASPSADPDDPQNTVLMQYAWACTTFNVATQAYDTACLTAVGDTLVLDTQAKITVAANTVNPNTVYKFAATVAKDSRSSTASVFITITPGSPPQVSIDPLTTAKVNINDRVVLKGKATSKLPITKTEWSIAGASTAAMSAIFAIPPVNRTTMLLNGEKLTPGVSYKFQLNATDSSGQMGSATIAVVANSPPSSGSLSVTPSLGYALEDKFSLLASDWVDEDLPLKYTFKYIKGSTYSGESEVALGASTPDALFVSQLGLGGGDNSTITLVVYIQDALGAVTRVTKEIQVKQMVVAAADQAAYLANKTNAVLAEALSGDPGTVLNTINALADMVNGNEETTTGTSTGGTVSTPAPSALKSCPTSNSVESGTMETIAGWTKQQ
ncbi:hypothetical protein PR001_g8697, partial [Phytophthora rubi]